MKFRPHSLKISVFSSVAFFVTHSNNNNNNDNNTFSYHCNLRALEVKMCFNGHSPAVYFKLNSHLKHFS